MFFNVRRERRRNMLGFKRVTIAQHERGLVGGLDRVERDAAGLD